MSEPTKAERELRAEARKGRQLVATSVRAWNRSVLFHNERRRCGTNQCRPFGPDRQFAPQSTTSRSRLLIAGPSGLVVACCLLLAAFCLLSALTPSLTIGLLPRVSAQSETPTPLASPTPAPSPSPTPTPVTGLHQWGAVTLFHGLP